MINRGSEWGRWDLHVHTKGTAKNDNFGNISFDDYCIKLFKKALEKDIKVIGITDYFSIANYKKIKIFQENIYKFNEFNEEEKEQIKKIFILPNVELRTTPSTDKGSAINFHLLINPDAIREYENRFTDHLVFTVSNSEKYKLCDYDLIKLGRKERQDNNLTEEAALKVGISCFILNPSDIINALNLYPSFRKNCIIAVSNSNKDGASAIQGHEKILNSQSGATLKILRESIYKVSDIIFSPIDRDFFLGKKAENQDEFLSYYGSYKACVHGCDAHSIDKLFMPEMDRNCYIKAEPSFEGLKQILHEPETRVYIGSTKPELKNEYEIIDHIELNDGNIENKVIYFNTNLTSIIGGRSSGKSTLLQCLAKKLRPETLEKESAEHLDELCKSLRIIWKDGIEDNSRPIEYFYQGHMYKKSKGEGIEEIVKNLLLQERPNLYQNFDKNIAEIKHFNSGKLSDLFSISEQIKSKKELLNSLSKVHDIDAQIRLLTERINFFQTDDVTQEEMEDYEKKINIVNSVPAKENNIVSIKNFLTVTPLNSFLLIRNPLISSIDYQLVKDDVEQTIKNIVNDADKQWGEMVSKIKSKLDAQLKEIILERDKIKNDPIFIKVHGFLIRTETLKPLLAQRESEKKKRDSVIKLQDEIRELEENYIKLNSEIKESWLLMYGELFKVVKEIYEFNFSKGLEISASIKFEADSFQSFIRKCINQQSEKAQFYSNTTVSDSKELLKIFDEILNGILEGELKFKQSSNIENFTKEFFDKVWFKLSYDVIYEGDNYNSMSQGKKAFVVLKMSLDCSESKCPIIIDQPEDDLDNRAIFTELVTYLKTKKAYRQIILVTHNANVVVNADSELVVVANQHGSHSPNNNNKKFQYKYGSIECLIKSEQENASTLDKKTIKEHICEILEGGDRAFKLREKKYNLLTL